MGTVYKPLVAPKEMEAASTSQYTAPNPGKAAIDKFTATNTSGSVATISVWIVPNGGSTDDSNLIIDSLQVAQGTVEEFSPLIGHILQSGTQIVTAGTGGALTIFVSGREIS